MFERHAPAALHVGLIENRKRQPRTGWDKECVEEILVAIERCIAGIERDANGVGAGGQRGRRNHDVAVDVSDRNRLAVGLNRLYVLAARLKIQDERRRGVF
jgi:hypothetical protein